MTSLPQHVARRSAQALPLVEHHVRLDGSTQGRVTAPWTGVHVTPAMNGGRCPEPDDVLAVRGCRTGASLTPGLRVVRPR